jgi:transposase
MDQYELIRTAHRVYGKSIRGIRRETGHHRQTIRKVLAGQEPHYRRRQRVACPVMDPVAEVVAKWLREDRDRPRKQRHTAARVYQRLVEEEGFRGAESTVRRWVREWKARQGEGVSGAVIPLDPKCAREAEVDWGTGWVVMSGERRQVKLFCMRSRFSGKPFVRAYPWERQPMFFDGHRAAFAYFGGVFPEIVYDNLTTAVRQILRGKKRIEQDRFVSFRSYYSFQARFCNPGQAREKGGVEGLVGYARRNFLVPLPEVENFAELNALLLERCRKHSQRRLQGRDDRRTIEQRHAVEQERLLALPARPFENPTVVKVKVGPYQTVQVDRNRYSVPSAYVGRWLWAHVGCEQVTLYSEQKRVAEHERVFSNGKWQLDPLHYLALLSQRVGAFESARPIRQWRAQWPASYERMLERLRRRQGHSRGTREFVRILQLHHSYDTAEIERAIRESLRLGAIGFEAVRHLLLRAQEEAWEPEPLACDSRPGVTDRTVPVGDLRAYEALLPGDRA